jgi:hypothetical protein
MTPTEKAIAQIEAHERECAIRYVTVIVAVALPQFMGG